MASLRQLLVALSLRNDTFNNGLRESRRQVQEFQRTIAPTQRLLDEMAAGMKKAGAALTVGLTAPIVAVAGLGLQFNAMQEQAQIAFTTMLGDGRKARDFLEDMKNFAAKTPFEFPDLVRASQRLLAMGFAAEKVKPLLTSVGDAAAGLGGSAEVIDRVTLALGQMQGRGRIATQEMNQLTEAGIPAWRMLAEGMGVAESKIRDMVEKGLVPAGPAIDILQRGMDKAFGGMMAKQAETFSGLLSTIKDDARFLAADLTQGLFDLVKGPLKSMVQTLEGMRGTLAGLSSETKGWLAIFGGGLALVGPALLGLSFTISTIVSGWASAKTAYIGITAALKAMEIQAHLATGAFVGLNAAISAVAILAAAAALYYMASAIRDVMQARSELQVSLELEKKNVMQAVSELRKYGIEIETNGRSVGVLEAAVNKYRGSLVEIIRLQGADREALVRSLEPRVRAAQEVARLSDELETARRKVAEFQSLNPVIVGPFKAELDRLRVDALFAEQAVNIAKAALDKLEAAAKPAAAAVSRVPAPIAEISKELQSLRDHFAAALNPADALNAEFAKLKQVGVTNAQIVAVYGDQILKASDAQRKHTETTSGLIAQLEPLAYAQEFNAQASKDAQKAFEDSQRAAVAAVEAHRAAVESAGTALNNALRPADEWNAKIMLARESGASLTTILRVYGDEILRATDAQRKNEESVNGLVAEYEEMARKLPKIGDVALAQVSKIQAITGEFKRLGEAIKFGTPTAPLGETPLTSKTILDMQATRQAARDLEKTVEQLSDEGYKAGIIMAALGTDIESAAKASKDYGFELGPLLKYLKEQADLQKEVEKNTVAVRKEAERWEQTWSQVMANIVTEFARGVADVIFRAKSFTSAMAGIGKSAGRAFIEAFFAELFNPLTQMLASWGRKLAGTLQSAVFSKIGGAISLGSVMPGTAGAAGAGGAGGAGGSAGGGMFGISSSNLAFGGAAALAAFGGYKFGDWLGHKIWAGRYAHKDYVEGIQNPLFRSLGQELQMFRSQRDAGTLTAATGQAFLQDISATIRTFNSSAMEFANQGKSQGKEVQKAFDNLKTLYGDDFRQIFDEVNGAIAKLKTNAGSGLPQTGLAISASTLFADAVDRLVPALDKLADVPRGNQITATFAPVITVTVAGDDATDDVRRKVVPEITSILKTGIDGVREDWTRMLKADAGVVTA